MAAGLLSLILTNEPVRLCYPKVMAEGHQRPLDVGGAAENRAPDAWKRGSASVDWVGGSGRRRMGR
jgi:hypothetical protein